MNTNDQDASFIAEALPAFISEAREQCDAMEQLLLQLESAPGDRELLDALFRCAHTVKGSAGIFGLDGVVAFTHHVETLLDELREGRVALSAALGSLLLCCNDEIRALVGAASGETQAGDDYHRAGLVRQLQEACGTPAAASQASQALAEAAAVPRNAGERRWHVAVAFGPEVFRNGMDPLAVLNYLAQMGRLGPVECDLPAVPVLEDLDPETCHLMFEFAFDTSATRADIEAAFSFVREDCTLQLLEPGSTTEDVVRLIEAMPEQPRLGDILVHAGAISRAQLDAALRRQAAARTGDAEAPRLGEVLSQEFGVSPRVVDAAVARQSARREGGSVGGDDQRYIRVQADRLDAVINLLGELVIASAGASMLARQTRHGALAEANLQVGRLIEEIRNGTLQLRMVPIGETFARFRRVVRDTAAELGKEVQLELQGGETELDKSVVERIADPLMHLVRNALDHGLEAPDERAAAGKPPQGRLVLAACHEAGNILIRIVDDGRGIRRDRVLARAWERGLVPRDVTPPDADIVRLIFEPGFSTAEKVTNLSGRGVGMDVVRRNIEALRGNVDVTSTEGGGSCVEIRLPLTLAIIDGFLVGVGASKFIFPLDAVVEVIESRPTETALDGRGRGVVELRGRVLPVLSLRRLYALDGPAPERGSIVVLQAGAQRYGVLVDQLLGQHQTVIKPLGRMFRSLRGMSGSSILGNGEVALIFDAAALSHVAVDPPGSQLRSTTAAPATVTDTQPLSEGQAA